MPKAVEDCVKKISGTNPRTKKPYTKSEKWAICTASHNKKEKSSIDEISIEVANATFNYANKLYNSGRAKNLTEAYELAQVALTKSNYNIDILKLAVGE